MDMDMELDLDIAFTNAKGAAQRPTEIYVYTHEALRSATMHICMHMYMCDTHAYV